MTVYLILLTAAGAALTPGLVMFWLERRDRDRELERRDRDRE